jgi:hypothetical protein
MTEKIGEGAFGEIWKVGSPFSNAGFMLLVDVIG